MDITAQHGIPGGNFEIINQIRPFDFKIRMPLKFDPQVKIAGTSRAALPLPGEADPLSLPDAFRNFNRISFDFS